MFTFWMKLNPQMTEPLNKKAYDRVLSWGARPIDTVTTDTMQYSFVSDKNPAYLMGRLKKTGDIDNWGYISKGAITKAQKKPIVKPSSKKEKAEIYDNLKKQFGTKLGDKS